ncbi:hypothetical protein BH18ACT2_BH18ACT2_00780 [soil metagenome]
MRRPCSCSARAGRARRSWYSGPCSLRPRSGSGSRGSTSTTWGWMSSSWGSSRWGRHTRTSMTTRWPTSAVTTGRTAMRCSPQSRPATPRSLSWTPSPAPSPQPGSTRRTTTPKCGGLIDRVRSLLQLRRRRTIILVDNTGQQTGHARGASAKRDAVDQVIEVTVAKRDGKPQPFGRGEVGRLRLMSRKDRRGYFPDGSDMGTVKGDDTDALRQSWPTSAEHSMSSCSHPCRRARPPRSWRSSRAPPRMRVGRSHGRR